MSDGYWFRAKRYGWGWGAPTKWQGWPVLVLFIVLVAAGRWIVGPTHSWVAYLVYLLVLATVFLGVCWIKGEPARWRWGADR